MYTGVAANKFYGMGYSIKFHVQANVSYTINIDATSIETITIGYGIVLLFGTSKDFQYGAEIPTHPDGGSLLIQPQYYSSPYQTQSWYQDHKCSEEIQYRYLNCF